MTLEAEGAYIRLLAYSWKDGSIPEKISEMAALCKVTCHRMSYLWQTYLQFCFEPHPSLAGRLINPRLEKVRNEQIEYRQRQAEYGRKGNARRWQKESDRVGDRVPESGRGSGTRSGRGSGMGSGLHRSSSSSSPSYRGIQRGIQNTNMSPSGDVAVEYPDDFSHFWKESTRRGSKLEASKAWKVLHPSESLQVEIHAGMRVWMQSEQWQDETKQPHIAHWLRRRGWEERVPERSRKNGDVPTKRSDWENAFERQQALEAGWKKESE